MPSIGPSIPPLPARVSGLAHLATNISWSWSRKARAVFRALDYPLWSITRHNPIELLRRVDPDWLALRARDYTFLRLYDAAMAAAAEQADPAHNWYVQQFRDLGGRTIAYFCAEFGVHNSVPIYSGGLGVLAGDHCKTASDLGVPLVGVGLLYTQGYFDQRIRVDGWQEDAADQFDPSLTPLERLQGPNGEPWLVQLRTSGRNVGVGVWRMMVGRVPLFLLDTDLEENDPADRALSHRLYGGGLDLRLRQEWILGAGGVRVLRALGHEPAAWHSNEGHPAFMLVERLRELTTRGVRFEDAVKQIRATSLFTTHTPVPAGHDAFSRTQVEECLGPIWDEMCVDRDALLDLGHHPGEERGRFHMAVTAIRLSGRVNAVSRRHGEVSRRLWAGMWPDRSPDRVPIGYVTNGVHLTTWMSHRIGELLNAHLGADWMTRADEPRFFDKVLTLDDAKLWEVHLQMKTALLRAIRDEARRRWAEQWTEALHLVGAGTLLDERAFTIGFARRFATYKRADLLFRDVDRLQRLLVDPWRPVQIVFAGKAHPADDPGKQVLQHVYQLSRQSRFEGRIAFVEDYEMHLAHRLVQGVDLWLNMPRPPLEASGTSGMKAGLNGVPQLSTLDGWWAEGFDGGNGWVIPPSGDGSDGDAADADALYNLLEREVVPLYYARDSRGIPVHWTEKMKGAVRAAAQRFTAQRMVREYVTDHYVPAMRRSLPPDDPPTA
ncbi:MAG TPA: alpha-glucan family phosphorylase [Gemmatimonadales bacterium]|nr:alpha-glucan family phosphorylase [Gemmatimonadales bacterium]